MIDLLFGPAERYAASDLERPEQWLIDWAAGCGLGTKTKAGVNVSQQVALTYSAVWCATRVLCEPCGFLPLITYRRTDQDDRETASDYFLYDIIKNAPNEKMAAEPFWEGRTQHCINWGGGFAEIEREKENANSPCVALHPIHASRVSNPTRQEEADGYTYSVRNDDGTRVLMRAWEMFHVPGVLTDDGIWGKGVIQYARESIGLGLATERHGESFFGSGGQPKGLVQNLGGARDAEARRNFRKEWREVHGAGPEEVAVLPMGATYVPIGIPNNDAQFLETRQFNVRDIARWYRVPLHMLMDLEKASYNSVEIMSLEFITHNLWPWLRRIQGQVNLKLIPRKDRARYYVEHNLASFLRGDLKSRYEAYRLAIMMGVMTINEARRLENLPGIGPEGDVHYVPLNMTTTERMMLGLDQQKPGIGTGSDQDGTMPQARANGQLKQLTYADESDIVSRLQTIIKEASNGDHSSSNGTRESQLFNATRSVLRSTLERMFTKESNAARRAAAKQDFETWSADFYGKHAVTLTEALAPAAQLLAVLGIHETAETLSARLIGDSKNRISAALSASPATLMASLDSWPTQRAEATADEILRSLT